jgi:hypothetical protein
MNARAADLVAGSWERWTLARDQLFVDLDLSYGHLPPGTRLTVGTGLVETQTSRTAVAASSARALRP